VQRELAGTISAALTAAAHAAPAGARAALDAARSVLDAVPALIVDYLDLRDAELGPVRANAPGRLLVAARLGATRLLDNIEIQIGTLAGTVGPDELAQSHWRN
jgi:pantoate--beta-alanine ligase